MRRPASVRLFCPAQVKVNELVEGLQHVQAGFFTEVCLFPELG